MERQNEPLKMKKTVKLNVLDALIIVFLVVALTAIGVRIYSVYRPFNNVQTDTYKLTVKMSSVYSTVPTYLHEGDAVWFEDGRTLGTVCRNDDGNLYSAAPAVSFMTTNDGDVVLLAGTEDKVDAVCTFLCFGKTDDNGFFLCEGVTPLTPGQTVALHTDLADFTVTVISIDLVGN